MGFKNYFGGRGVHGQELAQVQQMRYKAHDGKLWRFRSRLEDLG